MDGVIAASNGVKGVTYVTRICDSLARRPGVGVGRVSGAAARTG